MKRVCVLFVSGLSLLACSAPEEARVEPTVALSSSAVHSVLDEFDARVRDATNHVVARRSCFMPGGHAVVDSPTGSMGSTGEPASMFDSSGPNTLHVDYAPLSRDELDVLGVEVSEVNGGLDVRSKFGDEPGLQRVIAWMRAEGRAWHP